ncbi:hypothetical protein ACFV2Q_33500 [Streptomyces sp. NPDC059650]|uniref:hypothetical protein n=1 Tax=Streptomyces sp. NPDC059650 TaxID=3346896 RepID=UPI0036BC1F67
MKGSLRTRLASVAVGALAIGGMFTVTAPAAQAAPSDCTTYLAAFGFSSTDINLACTVGGSGLPADSALCRLLLTSVSAVPPALAQTACSLAKP